MAQSPNTSSVPYAWQPSDVSTFTQQSQNLGQQAPNEGIQTGLESVQGKTGEAAAKAGTSGQNVAAGANQVATGAQVTPNAAQSGQPTIQPYQVTAAAPSAPSTDIQTSTNVTTPTLNPNTQAYLSTIFPQGIPQSVLAALNSNLQGNTSGNYNPVTATAIGGTSPELNPAQANAFLSNTANPLTVPTLPGPVTSTPASNGVQNNLYEGHLNTDTSQSTPTTPNNQTSPGLAVSPSLPVAQVYQNYLDSLSAGVKNASLNPATVSGFQNYIQGQLASGQQNIGQQYQTQQGALSSENTQKQSDISNYISGLNTNLQNYKTQNQDLSNIGSQSAAEQLSAARNAVLTGAGANQGPTAGVEALGAINPNAVTNSRTAVLAQQAQSDAIQNAQSVAAESQNQNAIGQGELAAGQQAENQALTNAGTNIATNQTNLLSKLQQNNTKAQQDLTNAYNNSNTLLSNQEQSYVNNAQQLLQQASVPESAIQNATSGIASTIQNAILNNSITDAGKSNLLSNVEAIWRIAVGSNPSDINFSNTIASILNPIVNQIQNAKTVASPTSTYTPTTAPQPYSRPSGERR